MIKLIGDATDEMRAAADEAFRTLNLEGECEVEIEYLGKEDMRALNLRTRKVDAPTDVLSFPALDEIGPFTYENYPFEFDDYEGCVTLGSIAICTEKAEEQAKEYGHSFVREMTYLFVHGLLHILGYDHENEDDKRVMRAAEEKILSAIGITE